MIFTGNVVRIFFDLSIFLNDLEFGGEVFDFIDELRAFFLLV